jgi:hypothetical protein
MKRGSQEEQALKLLIMGDDVNRTINYLECVNPKDIQHLFNVSIHRLDDAGRELFIEAVLKDLKLLSVLIAKLMLKKDYIPTEEALDFFMEADSFKKQDETQ